MFGWGKRDADMDLKLDMTIFMDCNYVLIFQYDTFLSPPRVSIYCKLNCWSLVFRLSCFLAFCLLFFQKAGLLLQLLLLLLLLL